MVKTQIDLLTNRTDNKSIEEGRKKYISVLSSVRNGKLFNCKWDTLQAENKTDGKYKNKQNIILTFRSLTSVIDVEADSANELKQVLNAILFLIGESDSAF